MSKTYDHIDYLTHMVNKLDKENKELKVRVAKLEEVLIVHRLLRCTNDLEEEWKEQQN